MKREECEVRALNFDEIKVGDRVCHSTCGNGTVIAKGDVVEVKFDHVGTRGKHWRGEYDRDWFRFAACRLTEPEQQ